MNAKQMIALLLKHGFVLHSTKGSHKSFYRPSDKLFTVVPFHNKDLKPGTINAILKQAGIDRKDLL